MIFISTGCSTLKKKDSGKISLICSILHVETAIVSCQQVITAFKAFCVCVCIFSLFCCFCGGVCVVLVDVINHPQGHIDALGLYQNWKDKTGVRQPRYDGSTPFSA